MSQVMTITTDIANTSTNDSQKSQNPTLIGNLWHLLLLRLILLLGGLYAIAYASLILNKPIFSAPILVTYFILCAISLRTGFLLKQPNAIQEKELFLHLTFDVLGLTIIFYYTFGPNNPFTALYLIPICAAAISMQRPWITWSITSITISCYAFTVFITAPLHNSFTQHEHDAQAMSLHIIGMWLGLSLCACLIAGFAISMDRLRQQRDTALAKAREQAFRDQRLVELGTLAAGAAHELGTPLATMSVIAEELAENFQHIPPVVHNAQVLSSQLQRCKASLQVLSANAGLAHADSGEPIALNEYLTGLFADWHTTRHDVLINFTQQGTDPVPDIVIDLTLSQAITNIFNNAADVSPQSVTIEATWNQHQLELTICDQGPGFAPNDVGKIGKTLFTTKSSGEGLGIGIFLSYATINRLGGDVQVIEHSGGGTCTWICLPLAKLTIPS